MHRSIDIRNLAYRTGSSVPQVQVAGQRLFDQLSGEDSDLTKALVQASHSSGIDPQHVLMILKVIAEDFRQPVEDQPAEMARPQQV